MSVILTIYVTLTHLIKINVNHPNYICNIIKSNVDHPNYICNIYPNVNHPNSLVLIKWINVTYIVRMINTSFYKMGECYIYS
jgi:hypothetical protein